jgi:hypothetical protein
MRWLAFALSLVLGVGSGWAARVRSAPAPSPVAEGAPPTPPVERPPCPDTPLARPAAEDALAAEEREAEDLRRQIEDLVGPPRPFPEDIDRRWGPETAHPTASRALEGTGYVLHDVRCETYPCLAVVRLAEGAPDDPSELLETLGLDPGLPRHVMGVGEGGWLWTVPLMSPPDPEDVRWIRQINHRLDLLGEDSLLEEAP